MTTTETPAPAAAPPNPFTKGRFERQRPAVNVGTLAHTRHASLTTSKLIAAVTMARVLAEAPQTVAQASPALAARDDAVPLLDERGRPLVGKSLKRAQKALSRAARQLQALP